MQVKTTISLSTFEEIFSKMKPGTLIEYRETLEEGAHYGKFQSYADGYVTLKTIPAYRSKPVTVVVRDFLCDKATTKPKANGYFQALKDFFKAKEEAENEAALALMTTKKKEQKKTEIAVLTIESTIEPKKATKTKITKAMPPADGAPRYRGVSFNSKAGKWQATGRRNGVSKYLGQRATAEEAAQLVNAYESSVEVAA